MPERRLSCHLPAALRALTLIVPAVVGGGLSGCSQPDRFPPACPALALLPDAADLTRFDGRGQDITDVVVDARITAVPASCERDQSGRDQSGKVRATLKVTMAVTRGPAAATRQMQLPYFVAVMENGRILDKQDYVIDVTFPANVNAALPSSPPIELLLPVTREKSAAAYAIFVGFQLQPDELALNRKRGAR